VQVHELQGEMAIRCHFFLPAARGRKGEGGEQIPSALSGPAGCPVMLRDERGRHRVVRGETEFVVLSAEAPLFRVGSECEIESRNLIRIVFGRKVSDASTSETKIRW